MADKKTYFDNDHHQKKFTMKITWNIWNFFEISLEVSHFYPFLDITFINEEVTGGINKEAIGAIKEAAIGVIISREIHLLAFLFYVLLFQLHNLDVSGDSIILIKSFMFLFEINKVIAPPARTAPFPLTDEVALVPNLGKISIAKWDLLSFMSVDGLLAKSFPILVFCLVVINSSCDNSSYSMFF